MTGSWFGGGGVNSNTHANNGYNIKEAVGALYPRKAGRWCDHTKDRSRFTTLLLEHGEKHLQDWAVIAYTSPTLRHHSASNSSRSGGRMNDVGMASSRKNKRSETTWAAHRSTGAAGNSSGKHTSTLLSSSTSSASATRKQKKKAALDKDFYPTAHLTKIEGRLHLCSKSLIFEPSDFSRPIIRCPFSKMEKAPKEYPNKTEDPSVKSFEAMTVEFESSRHLTMKANNAISPFENVPVHTLFRFTFLHSSPTSFVELCKHLFTIWHNFRSKTSTTTTRSPLSELDDLLKPMLDRPFDPVNLLDVRERVLTSNIRCNFLTPLQAQPGCLVVTEERMYFQPALGVIGVETTAKAKTWSLQRDLQATARRYYGLKDSALELFWKDGSSTLIGFERKHEREQVLRLVPTHESNGSNHIIPCHTDREFIVQASQEWQRGNITNYDYLLLLNSAAGRTVQDLSRYPVFPWVISDYESSTLDLTKEETFRDLSKPIGALNEKRLKYFQQRLEGMADMEDNFLYGTHYSAAGYVLYYLVRSMPEHMLCLQNGKFDAPDRLFHSIGQCHSCVLSNHADVKELIPEFYSPNNDFDFLINAQGLQLGATQMGDRVNDVSLPPWAKSPRDFLRKNRKALESDICTAMLPRWIDLIFGSKSRGEAAKEANNLFHRSAYLGPTDLAALPTQEERFQAELQATEFGIVPDQLFVGRHPLRHETVDDSFVNPEVGRTFSGTDDGKADAWELLESPSIENDDINQGRFQEEPTTSTPWEDEDPTSPFLQDNFNKQNTDNDRHNSLPQKPKNPFHVDTNERSVENNQRLRKIPTSGSGDAGDSYGSNLRSSSFSYLGKESNDAHGDFDGKGSSPRSTIGPASPTKPTPATSSEWDVKFIEKRKVHDDAISGCAMFPAEGDRSMLVTTSLDGGLKVHTVRLGLSDSEKKETEGGITGTLSRFSYITMSRGQFLPTDESKLTEYRTHSSRDPLACLCMAGDGQGGKVAFAGGHDDVVLAYGINSACAVASIYSHRDAVTGLDMLYRPPLTMQSALWPKNATHIMVSGSWDATIKVWSVIVANGETVSIDKEPLAELFDADSSIVSVSAIACPDEGGIIVGAGSADGSFCVWNLHSNGVQVVIHKEPSRRGSGPCSVVKWSSERGQLSLFTGFATGKVASYSLVDGAMRKASVASVGVPVQSLVYAEGILLVGCSDGGLRLIPIRDGTYFTPDLSLWPSVNNKSSPGLTSVNLSIMGMKKGDAGTCICCTGGEDGSIAIFEIKRASSRKA